MAAEFVREISEKELVHERLGESFETALSTYDTQRRVQVLIDEFLPRDAIVGKKVLDVGTGLGFFAERLSKLGAKVTAVDIGEGMLRKVRHRVGCECRQVDALGLLDVFGPESFDVVVSSECIEHTPDPGLAIHQMRAVLKSGGYLSISTPNLIWYPIVWTATKLKFRPFDGLENFSTFKRLRRTFAKEGLIIRKEKGLHLFPFQLKAHRTLTWCDDHLQLLKPFMINICLLGQVEDPA